MSSVVNPASLNFSRSIGMNPNYFLIIHQGNEAACNVLVLHLFPDKPTHVFFNAAVIALGLMARRLWGTVAQLLSSSRIKTMRADLFRIGPAIFITPLHPNGGIIGFRLRFFQSLNRYVCNQSRMTGDDASKIRFLIVQNLVTGSIHYQ